MDSFYEQLRRVINDKSVEIARTDFGHRPASPPSRMDTEMFRALENATKAMYPGAIVLPSMLTGATDMAQLRGKGVQAYGIGPAVDEREGALGLAHADDEKLAVTSLHQFVEFQIRAVLEVAAERH